MERMIEMPSYPLTEMYEKWGRGFKKGRGLVDQAFLLCERCSHGKLETIVPPALLYGPGYRTRSAASSGAESAIYRFVGFIDKQFDRDGYDTVIDIGANDGSLLGYFDDKRRIAIDPNAADVEGVEVIRAYIENVDLKPFKGRKLIVSSHTIEHIEKPQALLEKVAGVLHHGDHLALQFPSLDMMVKDRRIDHIHHQHIHYYSERSICLLLAQYGLEVVATQFDPMHYGALMVMARRGKGEILGNRIHDSDIQNAYEAFVHEATGAHVPQGAVAFGAALMLPVLAYWMQGLDAVDFIADNDKSKNGLRYINLNKRIKSDFNLRYRDVVITGVATKMAARALVTEAIEQGAERVIVPLHTL